MPSKTVFVSYSHRDEPYLEGLNTYLRPLERRSDIKAEVWSDQKLGAGEEWHDQIQQALSGASVAVLLVSQHFLNSEYVRKNELPSLLAAAKKGQVTLVPLYVNVSTADEDLGEIKQSGTGEPTEQVSLTNFQGVNDPRTPLVEMTDPERDRVYLRTTQRIYELLKGTAAAQRTRSEGGPRSLADTLRDQLQQQVEERYEIQGLIAHGMSSVIFRAQDRGTLDRTVAIKVTKPHELSVSPDLMERIKSGLQVAGALHNPSIITVYDSDSSPVIYTVMEYVDGIPLGKMISLLGRQPLGKVIDFVVRLGKAFDYIHGIGCRHGHLRPSHVLVDRTGLPKISPFHLPPGETGQLTRGGVTDFIESLKYQSPEEFIGGEPATELSDQYSLGLLAYEMIVGQPIISATRARDVVLMKDEFICSPPRLDERCGEIVPELADVIDRMLRRDPNERYVTMRGVLDDLEEAQSTIKRRLSSTIAEHWKRARYGYDRYRQRIDFFEAFYSRLLRRLPIEVAERFSPDMSHQYRALREGLDILLWLPTEPGNEALILERLASSHQGRRLLPEHYDIFMKTIIETILDLDPRAKKSDWEEALRPGFEFFRTAGAVPECAGGMKTTGIESS